MNDYRKEFVEKAWDKIDRDHIGVLEISDIKGLYDASQHPLVIFGKKSEDEILKEFLETFEMHHDMSHNWNPNGKVSKQEFNEY